MRRIASVISGGLFYAVLLGVCSPYAHGQDAAIPRGANLHLVGELLPSPPQQMAVWKAGETKLSKEFVDATAVLFQQGLADPRACEYREIEVLVGGSEPPWPDKIVKTHGWVIPDTDTKAQRFGICWNGLVYPLASIGKPADLRADALAASKVEPTWRFGEDMCLCHPSEERSVSYESPLPIKACLLMRLGEAELAENVWNRWTSGLRSYSAERGFLSVEESVEPNRPILKDPYLVLANCWTLALFDRAEAAHVRSDDRIALASLEMLNSVWPAVKTEAEKRGFREPSPRGNAFAPYFLISPNRVHELLADQRRRAEERKKGTQPPVLSGQYHDPEPFFEAITKRVGQFPDKKHRITFLLHELEEASQDTFGLVASSSGAIYAGCDIFVSLLIEQGEDAVEPLLTCLENDNRLTRLQRRDERYPLGVYSFAESALPLILKMPFHDPDEVVPACDESKHRQAVAARIRAYWKRSKNLSPAERWYGVLADDQAQPYQWLAAAHAIVQPTRVLVSLDSLAHGWERDWWRPDAKREMHGEVLRNKTNPSVVELMVKRIKLLDEPYCGLLAKRKKLDEEIKKLVAQAKKLVDGPPPEYERVVHWQEEREQQRAELDQQIGDDQLGWSASFIKGCDIAFCLAQWDSAAALNILREQTTLCRQAVADYGNSFKEYLTRLLSVRANAGDRQADDELRSTSQK